MQREIKFRAWDTEKKEMAIVNYMRFDDSEIGLMDSECRTWTTIRDYIAIPMQYTGLHDKNGKEIYEGDILLWGDDNRQNRVVFSQGGFQMQRYGGLAPLRHFNLINSETMDTEVIGNIHDNPELLEVSE